MKKTLWLIMLMTISIMVGGCSSAVVETPDSIADENLILDQNDSVAVDIEVSVPITI